MVRALERQPDRRYSTAGGTGIGYTTDARTHSENRPMFTVTINGAPHNLPNPVTVIELLQRLGFDRRPVAVEVNEQVVPRVRYAEERVAAGDRIEIATLVGGGSEPPLTPPPLPATGERGRGEGDKPLVIGKFRFTSRLITGTGKYASYDLMRDCLAASGCEVTTVAVRRERLVDREGRNILDYLDLKRYTILPNTAGCFSAEDAIRHARLAREF